jgi:hypothetical protein
VRWLTFLFLACGSPPPPAPSAVINASPASVCAGQETVVVLDSTGTAGHLTLVPAPPDMTEYPLKVHWTFPGHTMTTCEKTMTLPCIDGVDRTTDSLMIGDVSTVSVRVGGDRPLPVQLHVENAHGGANDAFMTVSITLPDESGNCPLPASP